ncbi:O-phosphoseryl-tRNA(Sec) selenium transferase [Chironomus tepperi]|uniref:O-phosphoseryl-tRNA(Sec) selenium transferase n=1 Tax=Chironomus tepperi TaxID=113505 RepID=UPI00391F2D35
MISDDSLRDLCSRLVPANYLNIAIDARKQRENKMKQILEKRKIPEIGLENHEIEMIVNELAAMDSNNFGSKFGVGEREGRIVCDLVKKRHYNFGHGIGRSGDLAENQPKAVGSSLMNKLTNELLLDLIQMVGVRSAKKCMLFPMATGMTMMLSLLTFKSQRPVANIVLWSRIDQKSCFKCILTANLHPIIIDPIKVDDELQTNVKEFESKINELGPENIVCIISTTSCFAPRACDDVVALAKLSKTFNIPHIINNAYGLQSTYLTHQIEQCQRTGNVDLVIQSTDKNLLTPVGGSIIFGFTEKVINDVAKNYAGRASSSQTLDVFMTLLYLGREGYKKLVKERKELFEYLKEKLNDVATKHNERILQSKKNPISMAMTLESFDNSKLTMIGSMLFTRCVSGARVIAVNENKTIDGYQFLNWGSHNSNNNIPYITAAVSIGTTKNELDGFVEKLDKVLLKIKNNES